ncbi:MAG: hypothetical protein LDL33_06475 [Desulfomonile sp.]|nr:hypothetical protein [Desulfomonile sp.]
MTAHRCHLCGGILADGSLKYQVEVRVQSMFDGVIPESQSADPAEELESILARLSSLTEEELIRQVYEHDVFVMCPSCKEKFLNDLYERLHATTTPEAGRAHLIN